MPSVQCGTKMCTRTRWCRVCMKVSMHLAGNILMECMNIRRIQDTDLVGGMDRLMNNLWNRLWQRERGWSATRGSCTPMMRNAQWFFS
jgi:hypothetical protein